MDIGRRHVGSDDELLVAQISVLEGADSGIVERAVGAVDRLTAIEPCADLDYVQASVPPPADEATATRVRAAASDVSPGDLAEARFTLALALEAVHEDPARARSLAEQALEGFTDPSREHDRATVEDWLRTH